MKSNLEVFNHLRYGENPHQGYAAHLVEFTHPKDLLSLQYFIKHAGSDPSLINLTDLSAAVNVLNMTALELSANHLWRNKPMIAVVVKHGTPCGFGFHSSDKTQALKNMIDGDPLAAFGGAVVTNFEINTDDALVLRTYRLNEGAKRIYDLIAVPRISEDAIALLVRKDEKCRFYTNEALFEIETIPFTDEQVVKQVRGGIVVCDAPKEIFNLYSEKVTVEPNGNDDMDYSEIVDLCIAHSICALSKSNTITYVKDGVLLANASGQQSRVQCVQLATAKLNEFHPGVTDFTAASDSFFPFPDGPTKLVEAGARTVFATTGAQADKEVRNVFEQSSLRFISMKDSEGRLFYGH